MTINLKLPNPNILGWIIGLLLFITVIKECRGQSIYTSLQFDPTIITGGPRIDLTTKNIDINTSYCIGKAQFHDNKAILNQYQIGLGYSIKSPFDENELILSIFGSYNELSHQFWKYSYGISTLIQINKRFYLLFNEDLKIWSTKVGFGFKLK